MLSLCPEITEIVSWSLPLEQEELVGSSGLHRAHELSAHPTECIYMKVQSFHLHLSILRQLHRDVLHAYKWATDPGSCIVCYCGLQVMFLAQQIFSATGRLALDDNKL
jgi:hypothetical protein